MLFYHTFTQDQDSEQINDGSGLPCEEDVVNWRESATGNVLEAREKGTLCASEDRAREPSQPSVREACPRAD